VFWISNSIETLDRLPNVIIEGADVAAGMNSEPLLLWTYHPAARFGAYGKGITNKSYTEALLMAYDNSVSV
jgi:hypothetical protein